MKALTMLCVGAVLGIYMAISGSVAMGSPIQLSMFKFGSSSKKPSSSSSSSQMLEYHAAFPVSVNKQYTSFAGTVELPSANIGNFDLRMGLRGERDTIELRWSVQLKDVPRRWAIFPYRQLVTGKIKQTGTEYKSAGAVGNTPLRLEFSGRCQRPDWHKWDLNVGPHGQFLGTFTSETDKSTRYDMQGKYHSFYIIIEAHVVRPTTYPADSYWNNVVTFPTLEFRTTDPFSHNSAFCKPENFVRSGAALTIVADQYYTEPASTPWSGVDGTRCVITNLRLSKGVKRADQGDDQLEEEENAVNGTSSEQDAQAEAAQVDDADAADEEKENDAQELSDVDAASSEAQPVITKVFDAADGRTYTLSPTKTTTTPSSSSSSSNSSSGGGVVAAVVVVTLVAVAALGAVVLIRRHRKSAAAAAQGSMTGEGAAELHTCTIQGRVPHQRLDQEEEREPVKTQQLAVASTTKTSDAVPRVRTSPLVRPEHVTPQRPEHVTL